MAKKVVRKRVSNKNAVKIRSPKVKSGVSEKLDSWENTVTGLGVKNKDKRTGAFVVAKHFEEQEVEEIYAADDMAKRIVDRPIDDMMRNGWTITADDLDADDISEILAYPEQWQMTEKLKTGFKWGRLYGGAGLAIGVKGQESSMDKELNLDMIQDLDFLTVLNRYELTPQTPIETDISKANFRKPNNYMLVPRTSGGTDNSSTGRIIHFSRMVRFEGDELPVQKFISNSYWHGSVFNRLFNSLRNFQTSHDSLAVLMQEFSQAVYKIENLAEIVAGKNGAELIQRRINIVDVCRSILNAVLIGEEEEFERKTVPLTGMKDVFDVINGRLVAATDMPHTILLGQSPKGRMGSTGEAEQNMWFEFIKSKQEAMLRPVLEQMYSLVFRAKKGPTGGKEPSNWEIVFHPLKVESQAEIIENRKKQAEIDHIYIQDGVVSNEEVANNRFGGDEYSFETTIEGDRPESAFGGELESTGPEIPEDELEGEDDE